MSRPPINTPQTEQPPPLEAWPLAPDWFNLEEIDAWRRLGEVVVPCRLVTAADLLILQLAARTQARVDRLFMDPDMKATTLKSWIDSLAKVLGELGLTPKSRKGIASPGAPARVNPLADLIDG